MAMTTTGNPVSVADRLQIYFSEKLLEVQVDELVLDQFGVMADLPARHGNYQIRFFKPEKASATLYGASPVNTNDVVGAFDVGTADEGNPINTFRENVFTKVDVTLKQYVQSSKISDVMDMVDAYQPVKQNITLMGRDAALCYDSLIRNAIVGSTHPDGVSTPLTHSSNGTNGCELFVNGAGTTVNGGASAANFATLSGLTPDAGKPFRRFVLAAGTRLRANKAPKINGDYVCLLPPQVQHDLVQDAAYALAFQGRGNDGVFKGQLARMDGFRFVEHTNPFIEDEVYGTYDSVDNDGDGLIYSTMFCGRGAYGAVKLSGTKSPLRPQVYIVDKPDSGNPAAQFILASWKAFLMAVGLDSANIVVGRSKSTFA